MSVKALDFNAYNIKIILNKLGSYFSLIVASIVCRVECLQYRGTSKLLNYRYMIVTSYKCRCERAYFVMTVLRVGNETVNPRKKTTQE